VSLFPPAERICAQNLSGVRIGDDFSIAAKQIGFPPDVSERSGPYSFAKWRLGDGNTLSATVRTVEGKIIYLESDWEGWNGGTGGAQTDFPDFLFGRTTRREIMSKLGSEGVFYTGRFLFSVPADKSAGFNTIYDISGTDILVNFITRIDEARMRLLVKQQLNKGKNSSFKHVGDSGVLVAIILARKDYVDNEWGERATPERNYRPVVLEALQPLQAQQQADSVSGKPDEIRLSLSNGVSFVPVKINDRLTLDFVIDSGAADVQIPDDVFRILIRTGTISQDDFLGTSTYVLADGTKVPSDRYLLRKMEIGDHVVGNVEASIGNSQSPLLLGQSFLSKLGSWTLDNQRHVLVLSDKR
jgi:predicted aspartyl protease